MMHPSLKMLGPSKYADDCWKAQEPFVTPKTVFITALCAVGLSLFGQILHNQHERVMDAERRQEDQLEDTFRNLEEVESAVPLTPELYAQCNPSLDTDSFAGYDPQKAFTGHHCGQEEASTIRAALDAKQFDYQTVVPYPYIFPSYLQGTTSRLSGRALELALQTQDRNETAEHGVLAKFFTWGLPVSARQLRHALGDAGVQALWRCKVIRPCAAHPSLWVGTVMFLPVPFTSVIVATDWASLRIDGWKEEPVGILDMYDVGLSSNAPPATGMRVLDVSHPSGVQSILAVARGAKSSTFITRSSRALRFAHFNARLNGVADQLDMRKGLPRVSAMPENLKPDFDLLLASPQFATSHFDGPEENLREVLNLASTFLAEGGFFALVTQLANPRQIPEHLCQDVGFTGFSGSVIYRNPTQERLDYALDLAREEATSEDAMVELTFEKYRWLERTGVNEISSGLIYGWRTARPANTCGDWNYAGMPDPWSLEGEMILERRPCFYNHHRRESCPHISR
jgi:hypothetical protein